MQVDQYGIILNTQHFDACVTFYKSVFGLPELYSKTDGDFRLTCLALGDAYLMLETGGVASAGQKTVEQNPTVLRFNVTDIHATHEALQQQLDHIQLLDTDWGTIIRLADPDGNPISIRESAGFMPA